MPTGRDLVELARKHLDEEYKFVDVPKDDPNWHGPWDCAEFVSWLVYQQAGVLYGCENDKGDPHTANAWTGFWKRDLLSRGIDVSVEKAAATVGGILLRFPPNVPGKYGHIVVSDGQGGTIEAMGRAYGVKAGKVAGRQWHAGILLPEFSYDAAGPQANLHGPGLIYAIDAPNLNPAVVRRIQQALLDNGFDPKGIDGDFGQKTLEAVVAFQNARGLVVDGAVGELTAEKLGITLASASEPASPVRPAGPAIQTRPAVPADTSPGRPEFMGPLIPIALQLLPGLLSLIVGDKSGALQSLISKTVADIAGTSEAVAAKQKIDADPAVAAELQLRLTQIAAEQEKARLQAQAEAQKAQLEEDEKRRAAELARFKESLKDVADARNKVYSSQYGGRVVAWTPSILSAVVILGFFLSFLFIAKAPAIGKDTANYEFIYLALGALVAGFTTVISFWLGSSQGSRLKDESSAEAQIVQANELNQTIRAQTENLQKAQADNLETVRQTTARIEAVAKPQATGSAAPRQSRFPRCVDVILSQEGGFSNRSDDPGGATNFGITLRTLNAWLSERGQPAANVDDVKNLKRETAVEIYRTNYWNVLRCDDLPAGVDLVTFDMGVNAGPGNAAKILQKAVGAAADGSVGPATVAAARAQTPRDTIGRMTQARLDFYRSRSGFATFGDGWTNRTNHVQVAAMAMAGEQGVLLA